MQDGIVARYLNDHCDTIKLKLCPYRNELPPTADDFLWSNDSVFNKLGRFEGMAIEDAAVLASCLAGQPADIPAALQRYAHLRQPRVTRIQRTARQNGRIYHLSGPLAAARDLVIRAMGGRRLQARQNWIYDWRE